MNANDNYQSRILIDHNLLMSPENSPKTHLEHSFIHILQTYHTDDLHWTGSKMDLIEIVHTIYLDGIITDKDGCPATFASLVKWVFGLLHVVPPINPRAYATRARARKGFKQHTFIERYSRMLSDEVSLEPLKTPTIMGKNNEK